MWLSDHSRRLLLCSLFLCLAACGFTLRGARALPPGMAVTCVQAGAPGSPLAANLKSFLRESSVRAVDYPTPDAAVLKVRDSVRRRVLSVDTNAKAREFEVQYSATFSLSIPGVESGFPEKTITLSRDYVFDRQAVLATNEEEAMLLGEMQRELARMIIEQIAAYPWPSVPADTLK